MPLILPAQKSNVCRNYSSLFKQIKIKITSQETNQLVFFKFLISEKFISKLSNNNKTKQIKIIYETKNSLVNSVSEFL